MSDQKSLPIENVEAKFGGRRAPVADQTSEGDACADCGRKFWQRLMRSTASGYHCEQCWKHGEIMRSLGMGRMP